MLQTGSSAGQTCPSYFIVRGQQLRKGVNTEYLMMWGDSVGSRIVANENAFMNTETLEKLTPSIIEGYRNMKEHARATTDWWILKIIDGFGAHLASYKAMKMQYDAKILTVKEEEDTSHACQANDDKMENSDKRRAAIITIKTTSFHYNASPFDQYSIVAAGLHAIRMCTPEIWIKSFQRVNLQPSTRVLFEQWCIRSRKNQKLVVFLPQAKIIGPIYAFTIIVAFNDS
mmetsp:Transcript_15244/g.17110  ORF Transcript_15244/g.17110 Transcript_15244/m.17110 type:complete len:229 (+) Transcript_15244:140-826(+)